MKKALIVLLVIAAAGVAGTYLYARYAEPQTQPQTAGAEGCPDEKIINRMPGIIDDVSESPPSPSSRSSYYVKDGMRKELTDYEPGWVEEHCDVPVQEVY